MQRLLLLSGLVVLALVLTPRNALAVDFTVNTTTDAIDDHPGDHVCHTALDGGACSLRAAIMEANATAGADQIMLKAGKTYTVTIPGDDPPVMPDLAVPVEPNHFRRR